MYVDERQLREFVRDSGLVSRADFEMAKKAAERDKESIGDALVSSGVLSPEELGKMHAYLLGIPFVNLVGQEIDFETLSLIPEPIARGRNLIALKGTPETLEVAALHLHDLEAIAFITEKSGQKILPRLTSPRSVRSALLRYQTFLKAEFGDRIKSEILGLAVVPASSNAASAAELGREGSATPIARMVGIVLRHALLERASDIHFEPQEKELLVRYRIGGLIRDAMVLPGHVAPSVIARIKTLASLKLNERKLPQDGRFKTEVSGEKVLFRVGTYPTYFGEKVVLRILREGAEGFTLEALGLHGEGLERVSDALTEASGLIIVAGPAMSGKTTTLYTLLDILNTPSVTIGTIEEKIEYQLPRVNQSRVRPEIGFSFASGVRALLRDRADIIMVGEIGDRESAAAALSAAASGRLVLAALSAPSASLAIARLLEMKLPPLLLSSTLRLVLAGRLVRELAPAKESYFLNKAGLTALQKSANLDRVLATVKAEHIVAREAVWEKIPFYKVRSSRTAPEGFVGQMGIHEALTLSPSIRELITKGVSAEEIEGQARKEGMQTLVEDGLFKAVAGQTTIEEVLY